jgi:L-ascorbate metabolism protein UlaG (beta-lactamase superfamily)
MVEPRIVKAPATQYIDKTGFGSSDHTEIRWLAGAGFMINARGTIIMVEPLLITVNDNPLTSELNREMVVDYPIKAADVPNLDAVLYAHSDTDHLGRMTAQVLQNLNLLMIGPPPVFEALVRSGIRPDLIQICRYGDKITVGCITVEVIKADHPWQLLNPARFGKPFRSDDCVGFKIITPDGTFLAPGDSRLIEEYFEMKGIDVLFLDASRCEYHINVKGATTLANYMSDALLIPYHYGTYKTPFNAPDALAHSGDPEDVLCNVTNREKRERMLAPGQPLCMRSGKEC